MEAVVKATRDWFEQRNRAWLSGSLEGLYAQRGRQPAVEEMLRRRALHIRRGTRECKVISDLEVAIVPQDASEVTRCITTHVVERMRFLYESADRVEHEQRELVHELDWSLDDPPVLLEHRHVTENMGSSTVENTISSGAVVQPLSNDWGGNGYRGVYNRTLAYRYAEQWWNTYNPAYANMGVDCTNFVSQVMHAGGFPMVGGSRKDHGWWYRGGRTESHSYSWAVAHSLALLLSNPRNPFRAVVVQKPEELTIGDVIAYDWTRSGRFGHNTVVAGQDQNGLPLVNAHTVNSHQRFYSYEDSYAWTPNTQYLFIHFQD